MNFYAQSHFSNQFYTQYGLISPWIAVSEAYNFSDLNQFAFNPTFLCTNFAFETEVERVCSSPLTAGPSEKELEKNIQLDCS